MEVATKIEIAVEPGRDSLCGAVRVGETPERHFHSWLGLLSILQGAVSELAAENPPAGGSG